MRLFAIFIGEFIKEYLRQAFDIEQLRPDKVMASAGSKSNSIQELTCASKTYMGHRITGAFRTEHLSSADNASSPLSDSHATFAGAFKYAIQQINSNKTYHNMNFQWDIRNGCSDELICAWFEKM